MKNVWHELANFESQDLVSETYRRKHNKDPKIDQIRDIIASFVQAREYFENAARAAFTVRPLLQYYGVASLAKGLILIQSGKSSATLKPSHGLAQKEWQATFTLKRLSSFGNLSVVISKGTFLELLQATNNRSYLKSNSSAINWRVDFPVPILGSEFTFLDIVSCVPDVSKDYEIWTKSPFVSAKLTAFKNNFETRQFNLTVSNDTNQEIIDRLFGDSSDSNNPYSISVPYDYYPFFAEFTGNSFHRIGDVHCIKPIKNSIHINSLGQYFAVSYILGMVVRYFPSIWIDLGRQEKGDRISPLIRRFVDLIQDRFPEIVLEFLLSPYSFETSEPKL